MTNASSSLRRRTGLVPLRGVLTRLAAGSRWRIWDSQLTAWLLIYLGWLAVAEVAVIASPAWGLGLHVVLLCGLIAHSSFAAHEGRAFLLALALAPLVRVVSLALPLADLPPLAGYALSGVPLAVAGIVAARVLGLTRRDLLLSPGHLRLQLGIGLLGLPLAAVEYVVVRPTPVPTDLSGPVVALAAFSLLMWLAVVEEFLFRGVIQVAALVYLGWWGPIYVSTVYALLHISSGSPVAVVLMWCVGLGFAWAAARTGSLLGVSLAHGLANVGLHMLVPLATLALTPLPPPPTAAPADPAVAGPAAWSRTLAADPSRVGWQAWPDDAQTGAWPSAEGYRL
ncbi:MAG: CPBP family intramembrane metalloprotease, partial [Chloroflexota bacterium]|nr:CPBP family intramembrane metalloprotease [Chloroflexota bacterium]